MKTKIKRLDSTPLIYIYYSFLLAFSDYEIKVRLSFKAFKNLLKTRDVKLSSSFGVFLTEYDDANKLKEIEKDLSSLTEKNIKLDLKMLSKMPISFILVGLRKNVKIFLEEENKVIEFKKAAYDSGTGTMSYFRGQGFGKTLINDTIENLSKSSIDGFILEVLENNEKAKKLYMDSGFQISRKFYCYRISKDQLMENINKILLSIDKNDDAKTDFLLKIKEKISVKKLNSFCSIKSKKLEKFSDFQLSWQNSFDSMKNIFNQLSVLGFYFDKKLIGAGIIQRKTGEIKFFDIDRSLHFESLINQQSNNNTKNCDEDFYIEAILLKYLIEQSEGKNVSILNIDSSHKYNLLYQKFGFTNFVNQYEMFTIIK